jgi:hypothetical protein
MNQLRGWLCLGTALAALTGLVAVGLRPPTGPGSPDRDGATIGFEEKTELMPQVLDRRLSLTEAAARFRELDDSNPGFVRDAFERSYPGRSDGERYARAVLNYLRGYLLDNPNHDPEAILPLEADLDRLARGEESSPAGVALRGAP